MLYTELAKALTLGSTHQLPADLDIFDYHFPGFPLLPGALSGVLLSDFCGTPGMKLKKVDGLRFRKPLTPQIPITLTSEVKEENTRSKVVYGKILSGEDTIADGVFHYETGHHPVLQKYSPPSSQAVWNEEQIQDYLPHGDPIILIHQLVQVTYPQSIQDKVASGSIHDLDQTQLVGTLIQARSQISEKNYWLRDQILPLPILSELVAQAGALTLAPLFSGNKPQVTLLGCDTQYFGDIHKDSTINTSVELSKVKRLGKNGNMIFFTGQCFVGDTKVADVKLNAMAVFN